VTEIKTEQHSCNVEQSWSIFVLVECGTIIHDEGLTGKILPFDRRRASRDPRGLIGGALEPVGGDLDAPAGL
jgi:hypothetical protein